MEDATNSAADDEWVAVDASDAVDAPKPRTVQHLRSIEEWDAAIASPTPILVDFAAAWCGPCQAIAPHFSRLAEHATALTLFRLDVDEVPEAQEAAGVTAMPTFQVWKLGEKLETLQGAAEHKLTALVEKYEGAPLPLPFEVALELPEGACAAQRAQRYTPLHRELFAATFDDAWLADGFRAALADGSEAALRGVLREEVAGRVFSFEMLRPDFCARLLDELANYEASGLPVARPNSMNNYGVIVNQIGMRPLIDDLQRKCVLPLTKLLFPKQGSAFDKHHSFMVKYKSGEDRGLDMHHDDSDVTLNVCLGREFTGATLSFCGGFGHADHRRHVHTYAHVIGRAIVHLGTHRHGADDIVSGERYNLIVWSTGPWRETDEYKAGQQRNHHGEGEPDPICLSYTHDPDFGEYKEYPPGKGPKPEARRMHLQRFTTDEKAAKAAALKAAAADDFKGAGYGAAACKYHCGAEYAAEGGAAGASLLGPLLLNEAQCRLNLHEAARASELCTRALERDPESVKGLYRRALARLELSEYADAQRDLKEAARLEPSNRAVLVKLQQTQRLAKAERKKERAVARAMFGGAAAEEEGEAVAETTAAVETAQAESVAAAS
jgi:thiol-disulfide isomerase/thioredoxin